MNLKDSLGYLAWSCAVTLWWTLCFILPYFLGSPTGGFYGTLALLAYIAACGIGSFFVVYFIGTYRSLCAVVLPLLTLLGAGLSFYLVGYRTTLTPMLIEVTLHTNAEEALGVISWQALVWTLFNLGVAGLFIGLRWTRITLPFSWVHALAACVLGMIYFTCNGRLQNSLCQRFPYNIPHTIREYMAIRQDIQKERSVPPYQRIETPDSLTVVLILGEAARADHLQLNGYERETTPRLANRSNIVSYPNIYSAQTHTLASLPYILTRADSVHEQYQYEETSFISIFRENGFYTAWISNQNLGSTFSPFLNESDTVIFVNAGKSEYVFSQWLDEELVPVMNTLQSRACCRDLYVLHAIGSHWYYNNHVPLSMQYFQPVTNNKVVTGNTIEQIVNSYDNTILYMDYFMDSVITTLEQKNAVVIYQSDHSEALGEDGEYLHANDTEMAKHPACVIWYSDTFAAANPEKIKALVANKDKRYRTDYVFYSILYAAGIEAEGDHASMNIFQ